MSKDTQIIISARDLTRTAFTAVETSLKGVGVTAQTTSTKLDMLGAASANASLKGASLRSAFGQFDGVLNAMGAQCRSDRSRDQ